jgi:hypothetical protein
MARFVCVLGLALAWIGCGADRTELVVVVDSDLAVPAAIDAVRLVVISPSGVERSEVVALEDSSSLPLILYLEPAGSRLEPVDVTATGLRSGSDVVERRLRTGFVRGQSRVVHLVLRRSCVGVSCGTDETCTERGCDGVDVPGTELPRWSGRPPPIPSGDAGRDAAMPDAETTDAPMPDGGSGDGGPDDGGPPDASCEAGWDDCDRMVSNGCETPLTTPTDCGSCGNDCTLDHVTTPTCAAGTCAIGTCEPGWDDCNGSPGDGCEESVRTITSCGSCSMRCGPLANATATCASGTCEVASCSSGFYDCDMLASNGCETNVMTSVMHCGMCGNACMLPGATQACSRGGCTTGSCLPGFAQCDGNPMNGCEPAMTRYPDADGDGYGNPAMPTSGCGTGSGVLDGTDCDDTDRDVHPGAPEPVGCDMVDQDCDMMTDDGVDGCSCADPVLVTGDVSFDGVTCGTSDFLSAMCAMAGLGDTVFQVRMMALGTVAITVTGGSDEMDLVYRGTSCPGMEVVCTQHAGTMMRSLAAGTHYFQITPDHATCYGPYRITFNYL